MQQVDRVAGPGLRSRARPPRATRRPSGASRRRSPAPAPDPTQTSTGTGSSTSRCPSATPSCADRARAVHLQHDDRVVGDGLRPELVVQVPEQRPVDRALHLDHVHAVRRAPVLRAAAAATAVRGHGEQQDSTRRERRMGRTIVPRRGVSSAGIPMDTIRSPKHSPPSRPISDRWAFKPVALVLLFAVARRLGRRCFAVMLSPPFLAAGARRATRSRTASTQRGLGLHADPAAAAAIHDLRERRQDGPRARLPGQPTDRPAPPDQPASRQGRAGDRGLRLLRPRRDQPHLADPRGDREHPRGRRRARRLDDHAAAREAHAAGRRTDRSPASSRSSRSPSASSRSTRRTRSSSCI